jgi:pSer/pThr/pTyr-binding forkhead associated (FHA) protein
MADSPPWTATGARLSVARQPEGSAVSASLEVVSGPARGSRLELADGELTLGRGETGAGNLGADAELSRRHARVLLGDDGPLAIEDLGSSNGTFVNGTRIATRTPLRAGDQIELGGTVLEVLAGSDPAPARPEAARRPGLRVIEGWAPGALIALGDDATVVGRSGPGAAALGEDAAVADAHVRVTPLSGSRLMIEDLGAPAGTFVGGERIGGRTILAQGDRFQVGATTLEAIEMAGTVREATVGGTGGVRGVPEGLFARIATRAPVTRDQVLRVFLVSLGWGLAANLLVRTVAIEVLDVPNDLRSLTFPWFVIVTLLPILGNTTGFYRLFRRPDDSSMRGYLVPTLLVPVFFVGVGLALTNHHGFREVLVTIAVVIIPVVINASLMLGLRERVARERVSALTGTAR